MVIGKKERRAFVSTVLLQEIITQCLPVLVVMFFFVMSIDFAKADPMFFMNFAGSASVVSAVSGILILWRFYRPVRALLEMLEKGGEIREDMVLQARNAALRLPMLSSVVVLLRWIIAPILFIQLPYHLLKGVTLSQSWVLPFMAVLTGISAVPFYYLLAEKGMKPILRLDIIAQTNKALDFNVRLSTKIITTIIISIGYPMGLMSFMILMSVFGKLDLAANISGLVLLIFVSLSLGVINGLLLSSNSKGSMAELNGIIDEFTQGNISALQICSVNTLDEIGYLIFRFNQLSGMLRNRLKVLDLIGNGDLSTRISLSSSKDEIGKVISNMQEQLKTLVSENFRLSDLVRTGAEQIAQTSQSLSGGATEQAASVEEVSSTITELHGQTKLNSEDAANAYKISLASQDMAKEGNEHMLKLVGAMNGINDSTEEIRKIVKVIDDIAFQINLLALNANVEAARAGKYGRGFSVVAEEVRNLAGRSAQSVKDTQRIVENAVGNISSSYQLAESTGKQLEKIVAGATKLAGIMDKIAKASDDQAAALSSVNTAMSEIENVTQINAASAEETASSAEELSAYSQELREIIGRFRLE